MNGTRTTAPTRPSRTRNRYLASAGSGSPSPITARTVTCTPWAASSPVAVTARAAAAAVLRATSTTGLPAGRSGPWPGPGRLTAPMSQAGRSSPAKVVTPAPPCAPTRTTSPGGAGRAAGTGPACRVRESAVTWCTAHLLR